MDDVTLGDGQIDIEQSILFGGFVNITQTFFRADADIGGRLRMGAPGHQFLGAFKVGQFIGPRVVIFANIDGA